MSVSMCITRALEISRRPRQQWGEAIAALPEACPHQNVCTGGIGCRARLADYLRVQFKAQVRREQMAKGLAR
ncbi:MULTISPECIES: hypothetical protein [unclassified Xanthomonas]|uniref:hypothetical protein n=1 Tax=unclassified Xanthomonas TaxID=2643310 RepID=UPI002A82508C|nr:MULTISPECIES: hypothetical protein [unclassified Xanthomonas]MDY4296813.1 hypothetical protein [Xanthomonas sp. LF02-5]MDY4358428.1 hypothetical protein [Xanthomonas sp. LF04-12]